MKLAFIVKILKMTSQLLYNCLEEQGLVHYCVPVYCVLGGCLITRSNNGAKPKMLIMIPN